MVEEDTVGQVFNLSKVAVAEFARIWPRHQTGFANHQSLIDIRQSSQSSRLIDEILIAFGAGQIENLSYDSAHVNSLVAIGSASLSLAQISISG